MDLRVLELDLLGFWSLRCDFVKFGTICQNLECLTNVPERSSTSAAVGVSLAGPSEIGAVQLFGICELFSS